MLTVEEREFNYKISMSLEKIVNSLDAMAKNLELLTTYIDTEYDRRKINNQHYIRFSKS